MDERIGPNKALLVLLVLAVGAAGAFAALWLKARTTDPREVTAILSAESGDVEVAAAEVIEALLDYDATTLEAQRDRLLGLSTGTFREQYEELLAGELEAALEQTAASSKGDIADGPNVAFEAADRATAVARVVQEVSARGSETRNVFYVMRLTLILTGDGWKADTLQILSQQSI